MLPEVVGTSVVLEQVVALLRQVIGLLVIVDLQHLNGLSALRLSAPRT